MVHTASSKSNLHVQVDSGSSRPTAFSHTHVIWLFYTAQDILLAQAVNSIVTTDARQTLRGSLMYGTFDT